MKYIKNDIIDHVELERLYNAVQWSGYTDHPQKMAVMLKQSLWYNACYIDNELVGLIRCVGDNTTIIYIQDILVHPDYQRQGIGTTLLKSALKEFEHIRQIVLITDDTDKTKSFYNSLGMQSLSDTSACGFIKYNFKA